MGRRKLSTATLFSPLDLSLVFSTEKEISELSSSLERALDYWAKNR